MHPEYINKITTKEIEKFVEGTLKNVNFYHSNNHHEFYYLGYSACLSPK